MAVHCFYVDPLAEGLVQLGEEESAHCARVLRLGVGGEVLLTDGRGTLASGFLTATEGKRVGVEVTRCGMLARRRGQRTLLAVAPTKNADRMEWLVEKATEIGCGAIVPLLCERSERGRINGERLKRVSMAALKQSQGAYLPHIYPMMAFQEFVMGVDAIESSIADVESGAVLRAVAHCGEGPRNDLRDVLRAAGNRPLTILVGPEGDFSAGEIALALENGFLPVSLGEARLRTETAALVSVALAGT